MFRNSGRRPGRQVQARSAAVQGMHLEAIFGQVAAAAQVPPAVADDAVDHDDAARRGGAVPDADGKTIAVGGGEISKSRCPERHDAILTPTPSGFVRFQPCQNIGLDGDPQSRTPQRRRLSAVAERDVFVGHQFLQQVPIVEPSRYRMPPTLVAQCRPAADRIPVSPGWQPNWYPRPEAWARPPTAGWPGTRRIWTAGY